MSNWLPLTRMLLASTALVPLGLQSAFANPNGPQVVGGAATVQGVGTSTVTVRQGSERAIIDWRSFDISAGERTQFIQPGVSSIALNRVTGGLGPSRIDGAISANGRVFLVNPDGMLFGPGSTVNTAGFLATTSNITNSDFMAGRYNFSIPGRPDASIVNQGTITASSHGFAALVAPGVRNTGTISATLGTVGLASANAFSLDFYGDRLITLGVNDQIAATVKDVATGLPLDALVKNEGKLKANGGRVELSAVSARTVVDSVINTSGVIEARSIGHRNGMIVLGAATAGTKTTGAPVQNVKVSGKLDVSSRRGKGGTIKVTGEDIKLAGAQLDASGKTGGGAVLVGGDVGGGKGNAAAAGNAQAVLESKPVPTATNVSVDAASRIDVSARASGNAGKAVVWADGSTNFQGAIAARGGAASGDGGFVEVSGKERLGFGGTVDTSAANGQRGMLLLDPQDIIIGGSGPWEISIASLTAALMNGDVAIITGAGAGSGDITVAQSFTWGAGTSAASNLLLAAYRDVVVRDGVTIKNVGAGELNIGAGIDATATGVWASTGVGTLRFEGSSRIDFSNSIGKIGLAYNPVGGYASPTSFSGHLSLNGQVPGQFEASMWVNNLTDLNNVRQNLAGNYIFASIDASATANWSHGFIPIGDAAHPFIGSFHGLQNRFVTAGRGEINNLTIKASDIDDVGLFGVIGNGGRVSDIALRDVNVTVSGGFSTAGALAGLNEGLIHNASVTGLVQNIEPTSRNSALGGLVGRNGSGGVFNPFSPVGQIQFSSSSATVRFDSPTVGYVDAGGLAGQSYGNIVRSFADGSVSGTSTSYALSYIGGLVGWQLEGLIYQSYSLASVSSSSGHTIGGGLVGVTSAFGSEPLAGIVASYAAGAVHVTGPVSTAGGLVGSGSSAVFSYWDPVGTGQTVSAAGLADPLTAALPLGLAQAGGFNAPVNGDYPTLQGFTSGANFPPILLPTAGGGVIPSVIETTTGPIVSNGTGQLTQQVSLLTSNPPPPPDNAPLIQLTPQAPQPGPTQPGAAPVQPRQPGQEGAPGPTVGVPTPFRPLRDVAGPDGERFSSVPPINETRFISNEVMLQVGSDVSPAEVARVAQQLGLTVLAQQNLGALGRTAYRFQFSGGRTIRDVIRALEQNRIVAVAQPNYTFRLSQAAEPAASSQTQSLPPVERLGDPSQYISSKFHLSEAHRLAGGNGVIVAVIDSQVDKDHVELLGAISQGYDAVGTPEAAHPHGTAMAGAIVSRDRLLGVAPRARILAVSAFSDSQTSAEGTSYSILKGIDWAVANGARVINMSFAGPYDPSLQRTLKLARDKGVILIAAAGNAGPKSPPLYPGADPSVIAITATDPDDKLFRMANRGPQVAFAAPGVDIIAPAPAAGYQMSTGTSIATAHVSGVVALMLERDPTLTPDEVRQILESSATDLGPKGRDTQFGWGLVNPHKALMTVALRQAARSRAAP